MQCPTEAQELALVKGQELACGVGAIGGELEPPVDVVQQRPGRVVVALVDVRGDWGVRQGQRCVRSQRAAQVRLEIGGRSGQVRARLRVGVAVR